MNNKAIAFLSRSDKILGRFIKKVGPITFKTQKRQTSYESLVEAIVFQQISIKAATTIMTRFKNLFPDSRFPTPMQLLQTPDELLGRAGLYRSKIVALKDIAGKTMDGTLPNCKVMSKMSDEDIVESLIAIKGVGRWTAEMLLIFNLARRDVLPVTDFGIRKGFAILYKMYELPTPKALVEFGEKWKPYRTIASHYLWQACVRAP